MSLYVKGFDHLFDGSFRKMLVKKKENGYLVKVKNEKKEQIFSDLGDCKEIYWMVEKYVEHTTLNKIGIRKSSLKKNAFIANGNKKFAIEITEDNFNDIYKILVEKYIIDRSEYFDNNNFMLYDISLNDNYSSYDVDYSGLMDRAELSLLHEDGELLSFEKKFLSNFVYKKLVSVGEKAEILSDYEISEPVINFSNRCDEYYICCGDMVIRFSNEEEFIFLFGIVDKYNENLSKWKKRVKKVGN